MATDVFSPPGGAPDLAATSGLRPSGPTAAPAPLFTKPRHPDEQRGLRS